MSEWPVWLYLVLVMWVLYGVLVSASILSSCRANQRATEEAQEVLTRTRARADE